jgi:phage terminase large subunit-like protein
MGSNQSGKSYCGAAEPAFHATGLYDMAAKIKFPAGHPRAGELAFPNGWTGKRFKRPTRGWLGGDGYEGIRDGLQRLLVGPPAIEEEWGTGMIPADLLLDWSRAGGGVPNVLSTILVRHATGGVSSIGFKSYDQGRRKWQGETLDYVGFDEEPPPEIYSEGLTRTNATGGIAWMTFTPLQGMTEVVSQFIDDVGGLR